MKQKEFDDIMVAMRQAYNDAVSKITDEMRENKKKNQLLAGGLRELAKLFQDQKSSLARKFEKEFEPADREHKVRSLSHSLRRHIEHEVLEFCDDKPLMNGEAATCLFKIADDAVTYQVTIPLNK